MSHDSNDGGFTSHLAELRKRLINSFIFLIIFFIGCYFFAEYLYGFLVEPYALAVKDDEQNRRLIFTALQETFLTYLKISFFYCFFCHLSFYINSNMEIYCARTLQTRKNCNFTLFDFDTNSILFGGYVGFIILLCH